jgi:hypothetical protein
MVADLSTAGEVLLDTMFLASLAVVVLCLISVGWRAVSGRWPRRLLIAALVFAAILAVDLLVIAVWPRS